MNKAFPLLNDFKTKKVWIVLKYDKTIVFTFSVGFSYKMGISC